MVRVVMLHFWAYPSAGCPDVCVAACHARIYPPTPADSRGSASEKRFQAVGAVARRPGPYFRGAGAVLGHTTNFLVSSESNVRQRGPWPAGPVRPSGPCCLAVAQAPFWVRQL